MPPRLPRPPASPTAPAAAAPPSAAGLGRRRALAGLGAVAAALAAPGAIRPARADDPVDVALVLAVDVSRSIDDEEARLQREGYRNALTDPKVVTAIRGGMVGAIGLIYVEWASSNLQRVVVPWHRVDSQASAEAFAAAIAGADRVAWPRTSISAAIDFSMQQLAGCPYEATRQVIDISGDGINNHGRPLEEARREALAKGVTINGLPIINDRGPRFGGGMDGPFSGYGGGWPSPPWLGEYYQDQVIGGPGAFVVVAEGFASFGLAVQRKLIREIA